MTRLLLVAALGLGLTTTAPAQNRELVMLQGDVVNLSNQVAQLQASMDERNALFLRLIEQVVDQVVGLSASLERVTGTSDTVRMSNETLAGEMRVMMQSLRNDLELMDRNVREVGLRLDALSHQMTGMNTTRSGLGPASDKFREAEADFLAGNYDLSRTGFSAFIAQNPNSPQAADAQLYLGDSFYNSADYQAAILEYDLLLQTYPNSDKKAEALYKKALAHQQLNQSQTASLYFQQVVTEYPESRFASMAQDRMLETGASR